MSTIPTLRFGRTKEIFHGRIVVRISRTGHGGLKVVFFAEVEVCSGSILRPLVTVEGESISDFFCYQGVSDHLCDQRCSHVASNAVSRYHSPTKIHDCIHVQHTLRCRNISNICCPKAIGLALLKGTLQQIRVLVDVLLKPGIFSSPPNLRKQIGLTHDAQKRFEIHGFSFLPLAPAANTADAVSLIALLPAFENQIDQPLVLGGFPLCLAPSIISTARNFKILRTFSRQDRYRGNAQ